MKIKKILSPEEIRAGDVLQQQKAETVQRLKDHAKKKEVTVAPDGGADITNREVQAGRKLQASEIRRRLKRINPNLQFEVSRNFPDITGIYLVTNQVDPMTLTRPWKRHICGMPTAGDVNEFSTIVPKTVKIPDPTVPLHWQIGQEMDFEVRGYRTVLARLIKESIITESEATLHFGLPSRSSQKWQATVN